MRSTPRWESPPPEASRYGYMKPRPAGLGRARLIAPTDNRFSEAPTAAAVAAVPAVPTGHPAVAAAHQARPGPRGRPAVPRASRGSCSSPSYCPSPGPKTHPGTTAGRAPAVLERQPQCPPRPHPKRWPRRRSLQLSEEGFSQTRRIPTRWLLETLRTPAFLAANYCPGDALSYPRISRIWPGVASRLTGRAPKHVSALQHCRADRRPAHPARLARAPVHIRPGPPWQV
jgi:hypothetical protein